VWIGEVGSGYSAFPGVRVVGTGASQALPETISRHGRERCEAHLNTPVRNR